MPSIREFKSNLSRYLREARQGRVFEITSHRKVVARVTGVPAEAEQGIARLISSGEAVWDGSKPRGDLIELSKGGKPVSALVLEDRG